MPAKKYSVEQIVAKLREHEKLQGQGLTIPQACKRIGISDQTLWSGKSRSGSRTPSTGSTPIRIGVDDRQRSGSND